MNVSKQQLATLGLMAALGLTANAAADIDTSNEQIFVPGGSVTGAGGSTITDATPNTEDDVFVIDTSATLDNDLWYNLRNRVVVTNGATLIIEPGTVFASDKLQNGQPTDQGGSLVITVGSQIMAEGTADQPILFTSRDHLANWADDDSHPTGKDPRNQGNWRQGIDEWGSVAILGDARISDTRQNPSNRTEFDVAKDAPIEGLPENFEVNSSPVSLYGGLNDGSDSGVMRYVSLSYGGDNFNPADDAELNGMSWGGVGRGFDASHIELFNNVDDGLEIFGGAANVKNLAIWNIGDDSFDVDQGWRGQAQFVLVVQGAAGSDEFVDGSRVLTNQGSGFGDNGFEMDGADGDTTAQPVTAAQIFNATVIGAPDFNGQNSSDHLIALRDNANVQILNSIFMTPGGNVLVEDNKGEDGVAGGNDGDGSLGYGAGSTLTYAQRWDTAADWYDDPSNGFPNAGSASASAFQAAYTAQDPTLNLLSIAGSLFYGINDQGNDGSFGDVTQPVTNNLLPSGATAGTENAALDNLFTGDLPIVNITRADPNDGEFFVQATDDGFIGNVVSIDPRAANDALASNRSLKFQAPINGFYTQANYRGAVSPMLDWLQGWTGMSALRNFGADDTPDFDPATGNAGDDQFILASPANNVGIKAASNLGIQIAPAISFQSVNGVLYNVVAVDAEGSETVVATVEGNGEVLNVADLLNTPIDASQQYEVRLAGL